MHAKTTTIAMGGPKRPHAEIKSKIEYEETTKKIFQLNENSLSTLSTSSMKGLNTEDTTNARSVVARNQPHRAQ